jgi:hypothetical protein
VPVLMRSSPEDMLLHKLLPNVIKGGVVVAAVFTTVCPPQNR